jgi:Cu(I)/Ag(I) efflux system membrane fusion protein
MKRAAIAGLVIAFGAATAFAGYRYAMHRMISASTPAAQAPSQPADGRKPLYWHDPMYPQHKFDKPGKSPFMDMPLVPVYGDAAAEAGLGVSVSPGMAQNLGVRYAKAELGSLEPKTELVGSVAWNERNVVLVQARAAGFVEKLHARAPLDPVAKGAPLVEILVPEWAGAQEEFLLLRRQGSADAKRFAEAARQRLVLLGMSEAEIAEVERGGAVKSRFTLRSPIAGVIAELGVREGMTVAAGAPLFRIVDLSTVWVYAEVPEAQAGWLTPGAPVDVRVPAWPEQPFKGRVGTILPEVNATTRTVRARVEVANPGARLKPGMFANLSISAARGKEVVLVPSEAVIRTGERNVVVVADGKRYLPVEVQVGRELGGRSEILKGLTAGTRVVASGQFLIDSEASLKGGIGRLESAGAARATSALHSGSGRITQIDAAKGRVELAHGPMPTINWPAMQMGFVAADAKALEGLAVGDLVEFEMRADADREGNYIVERIRKKAAK